MLHWPKLPRLTFVLTPKAITISRATEKTANPGVTSTDEFQAPYQLDAPTPDVVGILQFHIFQLTNAIPWYATQRSTATCVVTIKRGVTVNYTIFATEDFLVAHDPLCTTYCF
ncbi:hypothetical protein AHF37_11871 [Paragonimus kellicotti]|nr:hypothetical protein AHF37_11871 [Paragonimus kellicotti]